MVRGHGHGPSLFHNTLGNDLERAILVLLILSDRLPIWLGDLSSNARNVDGYRTRQVAACIRLVLRTDTVLETY